MLENTIHTHIARARIVFIATALALVVAACGATAAQTNSTAETQISAGTLDYDTARHMGQLEAGVGSSSLDYDTARHIGTLSAP